MLCLIMELSNYIGVQLQQSLPYTMQAKLIPLIHVVFTIHTKNTNQNVPRPLLHFRLFLCEGKTIWSPLFTLIL